MGKLVSKGNAVAVENFLKELRDHEVSQAILSCEHGGRNSKSALHCAATLGRSEILILLLSQRVDPNSTDDTGNTPLHFAADLGHARAARLLLHAFADPEASNNFGRKPVDNARAASWDSEKVATGKSWIHRMFEGQNCPWESLPAENALVQRVSAITKEVPQMGSTSRQFIKNVGVPSAPQDNSLSMDDDPASLPHRTAATGCGGCLLISLHGWACSENRCSASDAGKQC